MAKKMTVEGWVDNVGKRGKLVQSDKSIQKFTIEDEIRHEQSGFPEKVIYLQRVKFDDDRIELRLCYYIQGSLPQM